MVLCQNHKFGHVVYLLKWSNAFVKYIHISFFLFLKFFFFFSDEGITETFECVEPLVGRYVSIVRSGVEDILSLCEVEVFSTMGLSAAASCEAEDLDDSRVAVFEGNCFHFMSQEVKGPKSYTSFLFG